MTATTKHASRVLVEVIADSPSGALLAEQAGADRIELCCAVAEGGLTPSLGLLRETLAVVRIPVVAMLRPRRGDFLYAADEFRVMQRDLDVLLQNGAHGIATGALLADGAIDEIRVAELVRAAGSVPVTFHRAFDCVRDPQRALETLVDLGVARLLTSGLAATATAGAARIRALHEQARSRLSIIAGAGVRAHNVAALLVATRVTEVHLSASRFDPSAMQHRNPAVAMGTQPAVDEFSVGATDANEIAGVASAARAATLPRP